MSKLYIKSKNSKHINPPYFFSLSAKVIMTLVLLLMFRPNLSAQINVSVSFNNTSCGTSNSACSDCAGAICIGGPADPYYEVDLDVIGGTSHGSNGDDQNGGCNGNGTLGDVTFYCDNGDIRFRTRAFEDDVWPNADDCVTNWESVYRYNITPSNNGNSGTLSESSNSSWITTNWTLNVSGNFAPNNRSGQKNYSCSGSNGAWVLPTNANTNVYNHSTDCDGTVWYRYRLTDAGRSSLTFDPDGDGTCALGVPNGYTVNQVLFGSCSGICSLPDGSSIFSDGFEVNNPRPGYYYVEIRKDINVCSHSEFDLRVEKGSYNSSPGNDLICNATNLGTLGSGSTINSSGNNGGATSEDFCNMNEPNADDEDETVWYKFRTSSNPGTTLTVDVDANGFTCGGWVRLYREWDNSGNMNGCQWSPTSNQFGQITQVGQNTDFTGISQDKYEILCPLPNQWYYIQVETRVCDTDAFTFSVNDNGVPAASDYCSTATPLGTLSLGGSIGNTGAAYSNVCATDDNISSSGCSFPNLNFDVDYGVWFQFTTASNVGGYVDIETFNTGDDNIDLQVLVFEGSCGSLTEIACGYNPAPLACLGLCGEEVNDICVKPSTTYRILVDGGGAFSALEQGTFGIQVRDVIEPANDQICGAYSIGTSASVANLVGTTNNNSRSGTTINATNCFEPNPTWGGICSQAFSDDNDFGVWYRLPAANRRRDAFVSASVNDAVDLKLALYNAPTSGQLSACDGTGMSLVSGSYYGALGWDAGVQGTCASPNEDHLFTCLDPTRDYYLLVDGASSLCGQGTFDLDVYYPLEGGRQPCSAVPIPGVSSPGWTSGGKIDLGANFCGNPALPQPATPFTNHHAVWWSFVAPASGSVAITMRSDETNIGDELDPELWVFGENVPGSGSCTSLSASLIDQKDPDDILSTGDPDIFTERLHVRCLIPGQTYFIATDGGGINLPCGAYTGHVGFFSLEVQDLNDPKRPNDLICAATPGHASYDATYHFTPSAAWYTVNKEAELEKLNHDNYCFDIVNEPAADNWGGEWSNTNNVRGGWYSFYAPPSGKVEIELDNVSLTSDQIDAQIAVYGLKPGMTCTDVLNASSINNPATSPLLFYGSSDDNYFGIAADEDLTVTCLTPFELYYIYIEGVNSGFPGDLGTGQFDLKIISYPQDPPALNDDKCNPIYIGQPSNAIGSTAGIVNTQCDVFHRNMTQLPGAPTLGTNGVTLVRPTNNHGGRIAIPNPPGGLEVNLSCSPDPGCIDGLPVPVIPDDYDRFEYPFQNFCATNNNDSVPTDWNGIFGVADATPRKSVWFMFRAPNDLDGNGEEAVEIRLNQELISLADDKDGLDLRGAVFESSDNTCNGAFYDLKSDYDILNFDEDFEVHCLDPGRYYWLMVDGAPINDEGYFGIEIERIAPQPRPANDYICDAYTFSNSFFSGGSITRSQDFNLCARTTISATNLGIENDPSGFDLDRTVWYRFTAPAAPNPAPNSGGNYAIEVNLNGYGPFPFGFSDKMDPQIAVWESQDGSCNFGTDGLNQIEITSEYDIFPLAETAIAYCIQPGFTYYIQIDGSAINSQGFFDITIDDATPIVPITNDDLANAITLNMPTTAGGGGRTTSATTHNYCSSVEAGEPDEYGIISDIDNTVWFKFTVPTTGIYANGHLDLQIDLNNDPDGNNDNIMLIGALYELDGAESFANLNYIDRGIDVDPIGLFSRSETINAECLKPGSTYYLQVDGYSGPLYILRQLGLGFFNVELEVDEIHPDAGNDDLCGAVVLPVNGNLSPTVYNNICKTVQADEISPWLGGSITANDQTVWFKFAAPSSGNVTIDIESQSGDNIDAMVAVYQSSELIGSAACPSITTIAPVDNTYDLGGSVSLSVGCLDDAFWHYIQVDNHFGIYNEGTFRVRITDDGGTPVRPYNDDICDAYDFGDVTNATGSTAELLGETNNCALVEPGEPNITGVGCDCIQKSVWYKFTAPTSGRVQITLHDADGFLSGIDPELILYSGSVSACANPIPIFNLTELESDYNVMVPLITDGDEVLVYECLIPGDEYFIQVDGTIIGGPQGTFDIRIEDLIPNYNSSPEKPGNNDICSAFNLTVQDEQCAVPLSIDPTTEGDALQGSGAWTTGNYFRPTTTKKDVFGGCNTIDNCGDIWYRFTMPNETCMYGSVVTIQGHSDRIGGLTGDYNDLKVIAYRTSDGTCNGTLVPIDCGNSDDNVVTNDYFHYEISGTPGEVIFLQVFDMNFNDEDNDDEEDFELCVSKRFGVDDCHTLKDADIPFMDYGVDYCWNVEGASGEAPGDAYGETNSGTNPTENSAYFKFRMTDIPCDSLIIRIWQPTPPNTFLQDGSSNSDQRVSLSIYREDAMLCDGTIDGALISRTYDATTPTAIFDNTIGFGVGASNLDTNKVYVIQIDGEGQDETGYINNGFIMIDTVPRCLDVVANTHNDTSVNYYECADGWRHYRNADDEIIFSVHPRGNNFEGVANIRYLSIPHYESTRIPPAQKVEGEFVMRRLWDFDITSGSIDPLNPVDIRFYYRDAEKQQVINAAQSFAATYALTYEPFEWFKSANGVDFRLIADVNPTRVNAAYSETGCQTLYDTTTSFYIGPPGIQLCDVFVANDNQITCNGVQYVEISGLPGFSGGSGAAGASRNGGSPLPVEFLSFVGWNDGDVNELEWVTATELNNDVFVVERSADAVNFSEIGTIDGSGTTNIEQTYNFTDVAPISGTNYYRLKQIDFDGSFDYSSIIAIDLVAELVKTAIVKVHPNPTNRLLNIQLQSASDTRFDMRVMDIRGQIMVSKTITAGEGLNQPFAIDVEGYPSGVYILSFVDINTGERLEAKFVKE